MIFAAWKSGCRISADAQKVADEILAIGNSATTTQILDKARDEQTELHKCFDWDDAEAAEKWRLQQARHIVCNLVIKEKSETPRPMLQHRAGRVGQISPQDIVSVLIVAREKGKGNE